MVAIKFWDRMGSHPQKSLLKFLSRYIYFLGAGDCWYEEKKTSLSARTIYFVWSIIANLYMILVTVDEYLAFFGIELDVEERKDLIFMVVAHSTIYTKVVVFMYQRDRIKVILEKLLDEYRDIYASLIIDRASVKKALQLITILIVISHTALTSIIYCTRKVKAAKGVPPQVAVTYYPNSGTTETPSVQVIRFFIECHWTYMAIIMYGMDALPYCSLVFVEHKFKTVQDYFINLKKYFVDISQSKSQKKTQEEIKKRFIAGIKLHESALWCATNTQSALGNIYSIQVIQCMALLVNALIKVMIEERNVSFLIQNMVTVSAIIFLIGSYMIPAGDITWEASEVSSAIYDCGWELSKGKLNRELRTLLVVAIQRSQVPIYMTAFGVFTLSYANFISVLRSSYSFFAVVY